MKFSFHRAALCGAAALMLTQLPLGAARQDAGAAAVAQDAAAAVQAVIDRYRSAYDAWLAKMRAAKPEERGKIAPVVVDGFVTDLVALAEGAPNTEAAAKAWMMVVQIGPQGNDPEVVGVAIDRILSDHLDSPETVSLPGYLPRVLEQDEAQAQLRRVVEAAPMGAMQAGAMLELARSLGEDERTTAGSPAEKELEALVARIQAEYADLEDARGRAYPDVAEGFVFSRKQLVVGREVPEIDAADTQGVTFKLSDYRGKVVLLDFWGNW